MIMRIIEKIDGWSMSPPKLYGWFHIIFLLLMVGVTIIICFCFSDSSTKTMKIICIISEVILLLLELIKQLVNSKVEGGFKYNWETFPFQFCETPMYILPFIIIIKNKKVQNMLISYMGTYALFAGLCIMVCPSTVLNSSIFANIRALVQHAIQVVVGIYLMIWNRKNFTIKNFLYASILFAVLCFVAIAINFIVENKTGAEMTMFYLSKDHESAILIVRKIKPYVPYFVYVLAYMVGFFACAFLTLLGEVGIYNFVSERTNKKTKFEVSSYK